MTKKLGMLLGTLLLTITLTGCTLTKEVVEKGKESTKEEKVLADKVSKDDKKFKKKEDVLKIYLLHLN